MSHGGGEGGRGTERLPKTGFLIKLAAFLLDSRSAYRQKMIFSNIYSILIIIYIINL